MSLQHHLNADKVLAHSRESAQRKGRKSVHALMEHEAGAKDIHPSYGTSPIPKYHLPGKGVDGETAYQLIHDELSLDGNPLLNLASFVHTHMDPGADKLMDENKNKASNLNLIDSDEYPATTLIHTRCVSILASLWHADDTKHATGTATTGSSEAIQLAGLAMKKIWQEKMKKAGKDEYRPGPNIVMGANAQVALEKFARYFDVEMRLVPVDESTNYAMSPKRAMEYIDENTVGVFVILGSTYTGVYENVEEMCNLLDEYEAKTGISVPVHVDAASGGFVAPFATPKLKWDFQLPRVVSINSSGHKFGKAYVGVGWVIWRDKAHLHPSLIFELHYLGSVEYSFSLNFSRPAAPIIASYFNFVHLGFEGYRKIALHDAKNARLLARALENSTYYDVISDSHRLAEAKGGIAGAVEKAKQITGLTDDIEAYNPGLPVVAFKFTDKIKARFPHLKGHSIQTGLRSKEWIVPCYELPPNCEDIEILRVVVREQMSEDLIERLVQDIITVTEETFEAQPEHPSQHANIKGQDKEERKKDKKENPAHTDEKAAGTYKGEGTEPTGHGSVC